MDIHNAKNTRKSGKHKITKKQFKTSKQGTIYQKKKTQILSTTQKQDNKQHIFYIVDCYVKSPKFLNRKYLYNHLVNAGLIPDKSMAIISRRYDTLLKKLHITMMELCTREKKIKPLSLLEDDLANQDRISIKTFFALCIVEKINVMLIDKRKVYEVLITDDPKIHVIHRNSVSYEHHIELDVTPIMVQQYRDTYYTMSSFDATIKSMGSYKLDELTELCKKLNINIDSNEKCNNEKPSKKKIGKT